MKTLAPLLWLDLETTGLDKSTTQIIELAACITKPVAPFERLDADAYHALVQPESPFTVDDFVLRMHTVNGLWRDLQYEPTKLVGEVDRELEAFIGRTVQGSKVTLAGSGVATFDFVLLHRLLPRTARRLTYFTLDTGVVRRYRQSIGKLVDDERDSTHRAVDDVREALRAVREYADADTSTPKLTLACSLCFHRFDIGDAMQLVSETPPRVAHFPSCAEGAPSSD